MLLVLLTLTSDLGVRRVISSSCLLQFYVPHFNVLYLLISCLELKRQRDKKAVQLCACRREHYRYYR